MEGVTKVNWIAYFLQSSILYPQYQILSKMGKLIRWNALTATGWHALDLRISEDSNRRTDLGQKKESDSLNYLMM
jgi:hypothetical protein